MDMMIGRANECAQFKRYLSSDKSEFIAVYGRRRVGKTFLIRQACQDSFDFFVTGIHDAPKNEQLINFALALQKFSRSERPVVRSNWIMAFHDLITYLETLPTGPKVIFIDELPWMDTPKSGFIGALENFWNNWAALRNDVKLIVCGSATSWMLNNLIKSVGGLHNRLTHHIQLEQFSLAECEEYFKKYGFAYNRKTIAECYMIMGGVPFYFSFMEKGKSLHQNIDALFFSGNAPLKDEFNNLYKALFRRSNHHIEVVTALSEVGKGLTRKELLEKTKLTDNGAFGTVLEELEQCGFIRHYLPFGHSHATSAERLPSDTLFQLIDCFTLFHFHYIVRNRYASENYWTLSMSSPEHAVWTGLAFERLCLCHINAIKKSLGISGVLTSICSWRSHRKLGGAQIDLLIDRKDETVNVCEMKYYSGEYAISADERERIDNRLCLLREETGTKKSFLFTLITSFGYRENANSDGVQCSLTLDDLFQ